MTARYGGAAAIERWLPVVGQEGRYEVSDLGRVRSLDHVTIDTLGRARPYAGKLLRPNLTGTPPYATVRLYGNGRGRTTRVHELVLSAFVGPRPAGMLIRHLNGDYQDPRLANLAYGTPSENGHDRTLHGRNAAVFKTHCPRGHEYTPENTYRRKRDNGRSCRTCAIRAAKECRLRHRSDIGRAS